MPFENAESLLAWCHRCQKLIASVNPVNPVAAHHLRVHLVEVLAGDRQAASPDSDAILMSTLQQAEAGKQILDLSCGRGAMERFAEEAFLKASTADSSGRFDEGLASEYEDAQLYLEALAQFAELPPETQQRITHAQQRSSLIRNLAQMGMMGRLATQGGAPSAASAAGMAQAEVLAPSSPALIDPVAAPSPAPAQPQPRPTVRAEPAARAPQAPPQATVSANGRGFPFKVQKAAMNAAEKGLGCLEFNDLNGARRLVAKALEHLETGTL